MRAGGTQVGSIKGRTGNEIQVRQQKKVGNQEHEVKVQKLHGHVRISK